MLKFKLLEPFQYNHWATKIKLNTTPEPMDLTRNIDKFDVFDWLEVNDTMDFSETHLFPVFMKPSKKEKKEQIDRLYQFVQQHKELFRSGKLIIILNDALEAPEQPSIDILEEFAEKIKDICITHYIDGNKRLKTKHLKHHYCCHWIRHALNHENQPQDNLPLKDENKTYIFLNKRIREHRAMLMSAIIDAGLRKDGYVTWTGELGCHGTWPTEYPNILTEQYDILDFEDVMEANPTQFVPIEHCTKSFLFLNTETHFDNERLFLTEKTFKPFRIGMPFITLSHPGTLEELHNMGFKTFSDWIDESYDLKDNIQDRIKIIISELHRFSKMSPKERQHIREEMKPVFEYNKKLVWELTCKQHDLINILEQISNESVK